jgi:hypothetical protein
VGTISVFLRNANANTLDDIGRLQVKLGITGTPAIAYTATVAANDDDRADAIAATLRNDPNVSIAAVAT